jgi:DNA-binding response OmpR family regulator
MAKVLIVDDDSKICRLFELVLQKAGYEVATCHNAAEGLEKALSEPPDVILSDYMMPDMDGEQFCQAVRAEKRISNIPFIVITGRGTQTLKVEGLSQLFDDYLEKPVDLNFLVAKVNAVIRRRELEHAEAAKKHKRNRRLVSGLSAVIITTVGLLFGYQLQVRSQQKELTEIKELKQKYDRRILYLESQLDSMDCELDDLDFDRINQELNRLIRNAKLIAKELPEEKERDIIVRGIKEIMAEFGEENYVVPPLFASEVARFVEDYTGPKKNYIERTLSRGRHYLPMMKQIFREKGIPENLAYVAMVESSFMPEAINAKSGAAGMWQFMVGTAREYGLKVSAVNDERTDPLKSTITASEYLSDLMSIFGKKGALLALASYNVGDGIVRWQLKQLFDPLEQRDFWYLFRIKALPEETRQYVPKIIASIIVDRYAAELGLKIQEPVQIADSED